MIWHQRGEKGELIHCVGISMSQFPWLYYKLTYLFSILMGSPQMIVMNGSPCQQSLSRLDVYNCPCLLPWRILSDICLWPSTAAIVVDNPTLLVIPACILHTKCIPAIKHPSYDMTRQYSCFFCDNCQMKTHHFCHFCCTLMNKTRNGTEHSTPFGEIAKNNQNGIILHKICTKRHVF